MYNPLSAWLQKRADQKVADAAYAQKCKESRDQMLANVLSRITITYKDTGETVGFLEGVKRGHIETDVFTKSES